MSKKVLFRFGIFYQDGFYGAINVDDIAYLTQAKDKEELLEYIEDVIQLLYGENTAGLKEDDFSKFCCYWLIEYDTETQKVKLLKEVKDLEDLQI